MPQSSVSQVVGMILPSRGRLTLSRDSCGCHICDRWVGRCWLQVGREQGIYLTYST